MDRSQGHCVSWMFDQLRQMTEEDNGIRFKSVVTDFKVSTQVFKMTIIKIQQQVTDFEGPVQSDAAAC